MPRARAVHHGPLPCRPQHARRQLRTEMTGAEPAARIRLGVPYDLVGTVLPPAVGSFVVDRVGAPDGRAHETRPLPVSLVSDTCAFRPSVLDALRAGQRSWRSLFDSGTLDATLAMVRMDLAVGVSLHSCVPADLHVLGPGTGLPPLPWFGIELRGPTRSPTPAVQELARRIEDVLTEG